MKKFGTMLAVLIIFLMPFVVLKAKRDAEREMRRPDVEVIRSESAAKHGDALNARKKAESVPLPKYTVQEQIAALNAGYEQMWALEQTPKAASPEKTESTESSESAESAERIEPRYRITDEERREIERIIASEGGYCEYRFQALVAQCILNGAERDNVRPSNLFARGDFYITHNVEPTEVTKQAVSDVFDKGEFPTTECVMYYYNPDYCSGAAHETKRYVLTCCGCRFFTEW